MRLHSMQRAALIIWAVLCLCGTSAAQGNRPAASQDLIEAVRTGRLTAALEIAHKKAAEAPADPGAQQVYGIVLAANGKIAESEGAFLAAVKAAGPQGSVETGLEPLARRGTAFYEALYRQKVVFSVAAGQSSARNNLGAVRILLGRAAMGLEDIDAAVLLRGDWGAPWTNAAVGWMERNRPDLAADRARGALARSETTAKTYTILAEAMYRLHRYEEAKLYLRRAEFLEPHYTYALYVRSLVDEKQLHPRDAERSMLQALALSPGVAAESRYVPSRNQVRAAAGNQKQDYERVSSSGQPAGIAYNLSLQHGARDVEDQDAYQRRTASSITIGKRLPMGSATLLGDFLNGNGGRPATPADENEFPKARFAFNRSNLSTVGSLDLSQQSRLTLHTAYRHNGTGVTLTPGGTPIRTLMDEQAAIEARWDRIFTPFRDLTIGGALLDNRRDTAAGEKATRGPGPLLELGPAEPNEQVLPNGHMTMGSLYAIARWRQGERSGLAAGGIAAIQRSSIFALPYLDWRKALGHNDRPYGDTARLAVLPRMMNASLDLYPASALADTPQEDPLSRQSDEVSEYNRDPLLATPSTRILSYELGWMRTDPNGGEAGLTAFYRHMKQLITLDTDPRLAEDLSFSGLPAGEAFGAESYFTRAFGQLSLYTSLRFQESRALRTLAPGSPIDSFPRWQGRIRLNWTPRRKLLVGLETIYVGPHLVLAGTAGPGTRVPPSTQLNVLLEHEIGSASSLFLNAFNITRTGGFYPTSPHQVSILGGMKTQF